MADAAQRFFISYAGPDRPWAEWVAWHLEQAGHRALLDVWDWRAGDDFVARMDQGLAEADAVVALLSTSYFEPGRWTAEERTATLARRDHIIPLALEPLANTDLPPLLAAKVRTDLHGLAEPAALAALRKAVNGGVRPDAPPPFPGDAPTAPPVPGDEGPRLPGTTERPEMWNVRRRNADFSGREAVIVSLRENLLAGRHSVVYALHGMGGIGKTQIALEYAHRFAGQYDLVWWIDAEQTDQLPVHYTELADRLGLASAEASAEHNARTLLQHLRTRSRWLIILDNAEEPEQLERWLPEGPGHVLITSRNPNWRGTARTMGLDVFTRADSLAYLGEHGIALEQAEVLAKDLGDLPLALAQAAGVIGNGMTVERYRRLLSDSTARILQEGEAPGYPAPLAASVTIATERLGDDHPEAVALLRLAAFLGPEPIPTAWLEDARPRLGTLPGDPDDLMWAQAALKQLSRFGLARIDHEAFQVHRLTQAVLRDHTEPGRVRAIHDDVAAVLAGVTPGEPQNPANWPVWASLASHLTAPHLDLAGLPELRRTLVGAVHFLIRSGRPRNAVELASVLREEWTGQLGPDHPDVLTCMQYLGHATSDCGDVLGAWPIIEDALARRRRILGDDHPDTLHSANDLGAILGRLGQFAESLRIQEDILARRCRKLGEDHPDTLLSAHNLAAGLMAVGELTRARTVGEDALARCRGVLGDDHPTTLRTSITVANVLARLGEAAAARRLAEGTLERSRRVLGDEHPDTLDAAHGLAAVLYEMGAHEEARRLDENTLERLRRLFGDDHPDALTSAHNLATNLHALGRFSESRALHEDTLERRRRILGDDHPDTLMSAHNLAADLRVLGRFSESRPLLEDTLERRRRILGDDHQGTLRSAHGLAVTLGGLRAHAQAAQLLEDTLSRQRRVLGDDHPDTLLTTRSLAAAYTAMGKKFKAQKLLAKNKPKRKFGRKTR
ncbi:FxSxx-COOH system tetratricopeptide repeat protein [Streptomyces deserti]